MNWTPYIFVRLLIWLMIGILLQIFNQIYHPAMIYVGGGLGILYVGLWWTVPVKQRIAFQPIMGILAGSICLIFGILLTYTRTESRHTNHILHVKDSTTAYLAKVVSEVQVRSKSYKATAEIYQVKGAKANWKQARGKVLLYCRKDTLQTRVPLRYGDWVIISGTPQLVNPPKNPQEFDYRAYLRFQNVYHQHFVSSTGFKVLGNAPEYWFLKLAK
jgi:competence protein ComEC